MSYFSERLQAFLSAALFLICFLGFFLYHTAAAYEIIRPPLPLGGWWSYSNLLCLTVLGLVMAGSGSLMQRYHLPVYLLLTVVGAVAVWHVLYGGSPWQRLSLVAEESAKLLIGWAALYLIGYYIRPTRQFAIVLLVAVVVLFAITPFLVQTDPFSPLDANRLRFGGEVASYQFFSNSAVFIILAALAYAKNAKQQAVVVLLGGTTVFLLGSRAELLGLSLIAILWLWLLAAASREVRWRVVGSFGVVLLTAGILVAIVGADAIARYTDLLNFDTSRSWGERLVLLEDGLTDIGQSPILGNYAGQMASMAIDTTDSQNVAFGHYMHSTIDVWRQFGLLPFLIYFAMSIASVALGAYLVFVRKELTPNARLLLLVSAYCLIVGLAAKPIYWPMPALAWGLAAARIKSLSGRAAQKRVTAASFELSGDGTI